MDIRYVMWILDKYAGCTNLIEEMDFVYASDEPADVGRAPAQRAHRREVIFACEARARQKKPRLRSWPGRGFSLNQIF